MISICAKEFDLDGSIEFEPLGDNVTGGISRRVSRSATLDGGVVIGDAGSSEGDQTLTYRFKPISLEHDQRARRIVKYHPRVTVSNINGVFEAAPQSFESAPNENQITLLVIAKLTEG